MAKKKADELPLFLAAERVCAHLPADIRHVTITEQIADRENET
jgi:hypothetical protein